LEDVKEVKEPTDMRKRKDGRDVIDQVWQGKHISE